jgi:phenylalanyl-tRNA synthetase beta chain
MKISLEWLQSYVDLRERSIEEISHALTMVGFEVEGIGTSGLAPMEHVVVGEIASFTQHPNADRLSLCDVDVGDGTLRKIICGAKNFRSNDRVIVALPGAILPGNFKIKESKLRGVLSQGMLCSERELGIGDDHDGIAILYQRPELGTPVNALYPEPDTVFDIEITPNRPDALSHIGIARELGAWFKLPVTYPSVKASAESVHDSTAETVESLRCESEEACPHYRGYNLTGIDIADSPDWLKRRLLAIGLRPINNIVDVTNYVLHETGQPLHAFDTSKICGREVVVRQARDGEKVVTLDEKSRELQSGDLVIADAERALVVAGVMGSLDAEVEASTRDVFLEAAYFAPLGIRRTSKRLGLSTDSSYRFERGVDPCGAEYAALRCIDLIQELTGARWLGGPLVAGEAPLVEREIEIRPDWIRGRIGFEIEDSELVESLERLELTVRVEEAPDGKKVFAVGIPSFRGDLYRPVDLVEEVIRLYGSDRIPEGEVRARVTLREDDPVPVYQRKATALLTGKGFNEAIHYSLREFPEVDLWVENGESAELALANPLASDASHLRPSLLPGLLDCVRLNRARHNRVDRLFECGRVFREHEGNIHEFFSVAFVAASPAQSESLPFSLGSGLVLDLLQSAGLDLSNRDYRPLESRVWQSGQAGCIALPDGIYAQAGILDLSLTRGYDLEGTVVAGSVCLLPEFFAVPSKRPVFRNFSLFPPAIRDLALVVAQDVPAGNVEQEVEAVARRLAGDTAELESVKIFDIYEGDGLPEGTKSVACELVFRHREQTLKDKAINQLFQEIISALDAQDEFSVRR